MDRSVLEFESKASAGVIQETEDYLWTRVLGRFCMYVMKNDQSVTPHLVNDGFWESWITTWFFNNVGPGSVLIDVGANTGYYSLLTVSLGGSAWAFEPNPKYAEMLRATAERHMLGSMFRITEKAVSDCEGQATLHIPKDLHGSASLEAMDEKWQYEEVDVETTTIGDILNAAGRYLVKIDAEGAEEKVWDGMEDGLYKRSGVPVIVLLEYTPGKYSDKFLDKLEMYAPLRWINHLGEEEDISREWIAAQTDWFMMVLRRG